MRHERGKGRGEGCPAIAYDLAVSERLLSPTLSSVPNGGEGDRTHLSGGRCEAIFDAWHLWWHGHLDQCFEKRAVLGGPVRYLALQPHWQSLLHLIERRWGGQSQEQANVLGKIAIAHWTMGNQLLAEPLFRRGLAVRERVLGGEHPDTLISVGNLAGLRHAQGKLEEAERLAVRSEQGFLDKLGAEHPDTKIAKGWLNII